MRLQSIVMPNEICDIEQLYYRTSGKVVVQQERLYMFQGSVLNTNTYMNMFDIGHWQKYADIQFVNVCWLIKGLGEIRLYRKTKMKKEEIVLVKSFSVKKLEALEIEIPYENEDSSYYYWEITASDAVELEDAFYYSSEAVIRDINLGVVICTYRRKKELANIIDKLVKSRFFKEQDELDGKLSIRIVDNASELDAFSYKNVFLYHNPNNGGAGGFARGIVETRKQEEQYGITHVVLMDDDVEILPETFYRVYALLSYMKKQYQSEVIAGRMFRLDKKWVQYTACEIWNQGNILHVGQNLDMTKESVLADANECNGEYTGWWFGCFPMAYVRENDPLPFFIHCDDVEYGLRHGGIPIILNGVQVWHETYEYRQNPLMVYYDTRNPLVVNQIRGESDPEVVLEKWKEKITDFHIRKDWKSEYYAILGMKDFLRGKEWLFSVSPEIYHKKLSNMRVYRIKNSILWRIVQRRFCRIFNLIRNK